MTVSGLVSEEVQPSPTPSPPRPVAGLAVTGVLLSLVGIAMMVRAAIPLRDPNSGGILSTAVGAAFVVASLYPLWPTFLSFGAARERATLLRDDRLVPAR